MNFHEENHFVASTEDGMNAQLLNNTQVQTKARSKQGAIWEYGVVENNATETTR